MTTPEILRRIADRTYHGQREPLTTTHFYDVLYGVAAELETEERHRADASKDNADCSKPDYFKGYIRDIL